MNKFRMPIIAGICLMLSGITGYYLTKGGSEHKTEKKQCGSEIASVVDALELEEGTLAAVHSLDKKFLEDYRKSCGVLCEQRKALSGYLNDAEKENPQAMQLITDIHTLYALQEKATFQHIIAVRDMLPDEQREPFIRKIQSRWEQGQQHLKRIAEKSCCEGEDCSKHGAEAELSEGP
jgi:hypothetical protein